MNHNEFLVHLVWATAVTIVAVSAAVTVAYTTFRNRK